MCTSPQLSLRDSGDLRLLKLGVDDEDYGLIKGPHYLEHIQCTLGDGLLGRKVAGSLLGTCTDVSVTKDQLTKLKINRDDIS